MKTLIAATLLALGGLLSQAALAADEHAGHMATGKAASEAPASPQAIDLAAKRSELERALVAAEETWLNLSAKAEAAN